MPREPDVFGQPTRPRSSSVAWTTCADLAHLRPLDARHRIEIDAQLVGMIEIVGAHRMRMQLEAREVRHPDAAPPHRAARLLRRVRPDGNCSATTSIQAAAMPGARFWKKNSPLDAVRIAHQHVRPAAGAAQRAVGDGEVVARQIELGVPGLRKQHLARVRDRHLAPVYIENLVLGAGCHGNR